jgi:hypothetical protein
MTMSQFGLPVDNCTHLSLSLSLSHFGIARDRREQAVCRLQLIAGFATQLQRLTQSSFVRSCVVEHVRDRFDRPFRRLSSIVHVPQPALLPVRKLPKQQIRTNSLRTVDNLPNTSRVRTNLRPFHSSSSASTATTVDRSV